ncbi:MAG: hypothetical protein ACSHXF_12175 [Aquaticitalea sp.]
MKKFTAIIFTVFLNFAIFSCTPAALQEDTTKSQVCCGGEGEILPEPPESGD